MEQDRLNALRQRPPDTRDVIVLGIRQTMPARKAELLVQQGRARFADVPETRPAPVPETRPEPTPETRPAPEPETRPAPAPAAGLRALGGGWYELPNGDRVQGKTAALEALGI